MARGAAAQTRERADEEEARRERLLRLLRLTASNQDGEALAALRRAAQLMHRMGLDWDALLADPAPSEAALDEAALRGRLTGFREGRAQAHREAQHAHARGLREGEIRGHDRLLAELAANPELVRALLSTDQRGDDDAQGVVAFRHRRAEHDPSADLGDDSEDRALIAGILDNPRALPRTIAFVADLARWLDTRGPLTPAQAAALRRTHLRWGRGAA